MRTALLGSDPDLGYAALKAAIMLVVAILGLRFSERRVLAELNIVDFVVAVAVGAIVGRTATSSTTSALTGVVALATLLGLHRIFSMLRRGGLPAVFTRRPVVLVEHGTVRPRALGRCGLSERDLDRMLRQHGARDTAELAYVLFEEEGALTIVPRGQEPTTALRAGLAEAGVRSPHHQDGTGPVRAWRLDPIHPEPRPTPQERSA